MQKSVRCSNGHHTLIFNIEEINTNIATNKSTVSWSIQLSADSSWSFDMIGSTITAVINGTTVYNQYAQRSCTGGTTVTYASGTIEIEHNANGSKTTSFSCSYSQSSSSYYTPGNASLSGELSLTDIPRKATITSATNFTDEQNPTINYSNPAGSYVYKLVACIINPSNNNVLVSEKELNKTGTTYTFNITDTERNLIRAEMKTLNKMNVEFRLKTWITNSNDNLYIDSITKECTIVNAQPLIGTISYEDIDSSITNITKNNQLIVQNKSNLNVTFTAGTLKKSATLSKYEFTFNGVTKSSTSSSGTINFGKVNVSSSQNLSVTMYDSRGNKSTKTIKVNVLEYKEPSALVTLERLNNYEDETYLTVDGTISSLNGKNSMTIKYRYKESGGTYNSYQTIEDNTKYTLTLDKNKSYIFNILINDLLNGKYDNDHVLNKGVFPLFIDIDKNSVGINCFPKKEKTIEIEGEMYYNGVLIPGIEVVSEW